MNTAIYWFRNDLRLVDNTAFSQACLSVDFILPVYIHDVKEQETIYGFTRQGKHRKVFLRASLDDLRAQLKSWGSNLFEFAGHPQEILLKFHQEGAAKVIYCEQIEAPEEIAQVNYLQQQGVDVQAFWQSSMLDPLDLPFELRKIPDIFTAFRREVERKHLRFAKPIPAPKRIPPLPLTLPVSQSQKSATHLPVSHSYFLGGSRYAQVHLRQYLERRLPDSYKETRNQLIGRDYSSKFSSWLALGCISARTIAAELTAYEQTHGANDGTYWLWFELLWRDYFRFIHFKYGQKLYHASGLTGVPVKPSYAPSFAQWRSGNTGAQLVDAAMRELHQSGYLSNRMRQIVASYWIYDLQGDWRSGAAWFESQLIDYDVYSNQGNWLYIAGRGTDPRGGRPFNVVKQAQDHDPQGEYQRLWL